MPNKTVSVEGYILFQAKYQEKDALITLLTKEKKLTLRVRGGEDISSKNHLATLIFNKVLLDASESGENYLSVTGVKTLADHASLYQQMLPSLAGQFCSEILLKCFGDDDELPYYYYEGVMNALEAKFDPLTLCFIFACSSLNRLGYGPDLSGCVNCGRKTNLVSFSLEEGGFLCPSCAAESNYPIKSKDYLKVMRYGFMVQEKDLTHAVLPSGAAKEGLREIVGFLKDELGAEIKSYKLLSDFLK
jgi:DNA repair protein RecO (recombination protein O)